MITRRRLIQSATALAAAGPKFLRAQEVERTILKLQRRTLEVNGKAASVYAIRQPNGQEGLSMEFGAPFNVRVVNELNEPSLIHWHGFTPPSQQDGVPGLSDPAIPAGATVDYNFPQTFGGTYWMHSHYGLQEQQLLTAPLIIRYPNKYREFQEVVVLLSDFSFTSPEEIYAAPQTAFVSEFVGQINKLDIDGARINVRPEHIVTARSNPDLGRSFNGVLRDVIFAGAVTRYLIDTERGFSLISTRALDALSVGDAVTVSWEKEKEFHVQR